jgi:hypothetical protein
VQTAWNVGASLIVGVPLRDSLQVPLDAAPRPELRAAARVSAFANPNPAGADLHLDDRGSCDHVLRARGRARDVRASARFGILRVPLRGGVGVAGHIGREGVGGGTGALHRCFQTRAGRTRRFMLFTFEGHDDIARAIGGALGKQPEEMIMGGFGPSWPKAA